MVFPLAASAQFYVTGDDPGKLKWNYIDTDSYRIIYPSESDSLAHVYARQLEKYKIPVSRTTGYVTGEGDGKLMPVVLHTYNGANGSVAWAPKRMDLFTLPESRDVDPLPWSTMLSVHESRHVTQMQFGMTNAQRPFGYAFGQMWNILVSILYPNMYYIEGDAVVAETALTPSGRGRTADFLNYYRIAFDNGDFRNWNKWLYGSQRNYYPNYYALGYMALANIRTMYDYPMFMYDSYDYASRKIWDLTAFDTVLKKRSGKSLSDNFDEISHRMNEQWQKEDSLRAPFMQCEPVSSETRLYTDYKDNIVVGKDIYSIKSGYLNTPVLVRIDSAGREHKISQFSYNTGRIRWSKEMDRIYWSEDIPDARWSLKTDSRIRFISRGSEKKGILRNGGNMHNPVPVESEPYMTVSEYRVDGKTVVSIVDAISGNPVKTIDTPDSLQFVETAWIGGTLYATAVSEAGFGIYSTVVDLQSPDSEPWTEVLAPQPVKVKDFQSHGGELMFTCDRTGVNELYQYNPEDSTLTQKTNTRYGASDFAYSEDGEYLYFSSPTLKGLRLSKVRTDSLLCRKVRYEDIHRYPLADKLAEQEKQIAALSGYDEAVPEDEDIYISEPKRYRKGAHLFNVHSWAPVYVSVDNIMNMSFDKVYQAASLGVSGIMQNSLSTGVGEFGYSAHKDPYNRSVWRHSGHAKFTYSGFYPVIEASVDFNDRGAREYILSLYQKAEKEYSVGFGSTELSKPYLTGNIRMYIPFNFSKGGWYKGVVPQVNYRIGNDVFDTGLMMYSMMNEDGSEAEEPIFVEKIDGTRKLRHTVTGAIRGYSVLGTAHSAVYPKWGIGLEIGATADIESMRSENLSVPVFSPIGYAYLYGYIPGLTSTQGMKLTMMHQRALNPNAVFNQTAVNTLPRGLSGNSELLTWISVREDMSTRVTADYGIPIYVGDWGLFGGFFYVKRLVLTPHMDYMFAGTHQLFSAGCDLAFDLNSLLWLGWPCSVGVTASYNGGPSFESLRTMSGIAMDRYFVGPTFNVTF